MNVITPQQRARRAKELKQYRNNERRTVAVYRSAPVKGKRISLQNKRVMDHVVIVGATLLIVGLAAIAG